MATAEVKITGLDGVLDMLKSLPPEVVSKRGGPVKRALQKGARVIAAQAALNIARAANSLSTDDHDNTGLLQSSVIVSRGKAPFDGNGERYLVRLKRKKYQRKGETVTTIKTGQLLEYGSSEQPAEPWLRPAFHAKGGAAVETTVRELRADIDRIVRKLSKKGGLS